MKRIIAICALILCISLCSCGVKVLRNEDIAESAPSNISMFIEIESTSSWKVVYHKDTKVMYVVSWGGYNCGNFTLLVNADGSPMVYGG